MRILAIHKKNSESLTIVASKRNMNTRTAVAPDALSDRHADKRLDILRRIASAGSISEAARAAGVSYKAAWQAVETLTNLAGTPLLEKIVGGAGGGGARLTQAGSDLLQAAERLQAARSAVARELHSQEKAPLTLGLRTSMRNQLRCTVTALDKGKGVQRVRLALPDGTPLQARLSRESVELLNLRPGLPVLALCKAAAVDIRTQASARDGLNLLAGTVARRSAGTLEASLTLACGQQLIGYFAADTVLRTGKPAIAALDDTAVVIALAE
jgi:molybdate transport system regulatory protein